MLNNMSAKIECDNQMNMSENIEFSTGFFFLWVTVYLLLRLVRPNAVKSHEMTLDLVLGSGVNWLFWFVLLLFAAYALNSNPSFLSIMNLVLDTRIIFIPWTYLSYTLVAFGFQLDKVSKGHVDWRTGLIFVAVFSTFAFSIYYCLMGIPTTPFSFP
jgi:hypothetical protein